MLLEKKDEKLFIGCDSKKDAEFVYSFFCYHNIDK